MDTGPEFAYPRFIPTKNKGLIRGNVYEGWDPYRGGGGRSKGFGGGELGGKDWGKVKNRKIWVVGGVDGVDRDEDEGGEVGAGFGRLGKVSKKVNSKNNLTYEADDPV